MKAFTVRIDEKLEKKLEAIMEKMSLPLYGYKPSKNETIKIMIEEFHYQEIQKENE